MHAQTLLYALCLSAAACAQAAVADRLAPPHFITCDRSQLTSYSGQVRVLNRGAVSDRIVIATDWGTIEEVLIFYNEPDKSGQTYFVEGVPMAPADWRLVEQQPNVLIPGTRATAWVCEDPAHPVIIDWQPVNKAE